MKKIIALLLVFVFCLSDINFVFAEDGMSTYENLVSIEDEFITRIKNTGVTDEQIELFLDDMDAVVDGFQSDIHMSDIDAYFITVLLQVMQQEMHIPILIAFDTAYQEEISYMLQYRMVPKSMTNFKFIVFANKIFVEPPPAIKDYTTDDVPPVVNDEKTEIEINLPFDDIKSVPWAVDSICYLYNNGVVLGTSERFFEPEKPVTREEFLKMVVTALLGTDELYLNEFGLSAQGKWFHEYLAIAEYYSLIQGIYDEDIFSEEVHITRQDMTTIAYRAALRADIRLPDITYSTDFVDMHQFTYYSIYAIKELQEANIIHGTGNNMFEPYATTTRAEAAKIVHNLMLLM